MDSPFSNLQLAIAGTTFSFIACFGFAYARVTTCFAFPTSLTAIFTE
ncbi:hypothetical protein [Shewanella sp. cp20]|nr:hypothetical protein [Shewanella sp. cp20]